MDKSDGAPGGAAYVQAIRDTSLSQLSGRNGLSATENEDLFDASSLTQVIALVLKGLSTLRR